MEKGKKIIAKGFVKHQGVSISRETLSELEQTHLAKELHNKVLQAIRAYFDEQKNQR